MTRRPILALPAALLLWPGLAAAQEGPSFNCAYASTRTEVAICQSADLARLERRMVQSYEGLVDRIGQREARAVADELLARRQACEGDPNCIAERLLISMEVFEQRGRPEQPRVAELEPIVPLTERDGQVNQLVPIEPEEPDLPLAAQAPLLDEIPIPPTREAALDEELTAEELGEDLGDALDGAELASSDGASFDADEASLDPDGEAGFETPLSWAFMDLERNDRAAIQERLTAAGFFGGEATGTWTNGTLAALQDFAEEEGEGAFDLSTQEGAALLLDYVTSDAFSASYGIEAASLSADEPPVPIDTVESVESTDW